MPPICFEPMIIKAKVIKTICRFKDERGEGVRLKLRIGRRAANGVAYLKNFPCGILTMKGILNIEKIDVLLCEKDDLGQLPEYEVLGWGNQNDVVKCRMLNLLLSGLSSAYMSEIPWEHQYWIEGDGIKKKLEKVFKLEANNIEDIGDIPDEINNDSSNNKENE
tara:strand:- start:38 stop:529 length:492 start_codon:yes stop_codon:yes gene_type:complete